jgi:hypothetical protein
MTSLFDARARLAGGNGFVMVNLEKKSPSQSATGR